ncbi:LeuA family protein [Dactylosporangium sp. CA-139114]|uniref:LeuA family protein n=1 Tax=Dactylosporangium sp. CA-139114 TaxID=3239931 RepID=UPI003D99EA86
MAPDVVIIDCTLREGSQSPGTRFDTDDSLRIAHALREAGIRNLEVGHPYAGRDERERCAAVAATGLFDSVMGHARANEGDIRSVADAGASWVGIFIGVNDYSQRHRLRRDAGEIIGMIGDAVAFARSLGLSVRYTVEDASRTAYPDLLKAYKVAIDAGANRICYADSVGICDPAGVREVVSLLHRDLPGIELEVHFHDDRGLATANALEAVSAGATHVSASVNGLGERCGITDTCILAANLLFLGSSCGVSGDALFGLSRTVANVASDDPGLRRPVVGRHSFTHTARLHRIAVDREPGSYHWHPPEAFGRSAALAGSRAASAVGADETGSGPT